MKSLQPELQVLGIGDKPAAKIPSKAFDSPPSGPSIRNCKIESVVLASSERGPRDQQNSLGRGNAAPTRSCQEQMLEDT